MTDAKQAVLVREIILVEDDSKKGEVIRNSIQENLKGLVNIKSIFDLKSLEEWLIKIGSEEIESNTIVICDHNLKKWDLGLLEHDNFRIRLGVDVLRYVNRLNAEIQLIYYSNEIGSKAYNTFVKTVVPEGTIQLNLKHGVALIETLKELIKGKEKSVDELSSKEKFIPTILRLFREKRAFSFTDAIIFSLYKKITEGRFTNGKMIQIGSYACQFYNKNDEVEKNENATYEREVLKITCQIREVEGYFNTEGLELTKHGFLIPSKIDSPVFFEGLMKFWTHFSRMEKVFVASQLPMRFIDYFKINDPEALIVPGKKVFSALIPVDTLFRLQILKSVFEVLIQFGLESKEIQKSLENWRKIVDFRLFDIIKYEVIQNDEDNKIITCIGSSIAYKFNKQKRLFKEDILAKFGCHLEASLFLYFVYDNELGMPSVFIEPLR